MAEQLIKVGGVQRELLDVEAVGLSRIVLAINAVDTTDYMLGLASIDGDIVGRTHSLKVPREAVVETDRRTRLLLVGGEKLINKLCRTKRIPDVFMDTKFSNDGLELVASVRGLATDMKNFVDEVRARCRGNEINEPAFMRMNEVLPPRYISFLMHHMIDPKELSSAVHQANASGFQPIAVVSSSKQSVQSGEKYGLDHSLLTASMTRMALDAGIRHLTVAAADAEMVRDVATRYNNIEDLEISGTGAVLNADDIGEHDAAVLLDDCRDALDYCVVGRAALLHQTPDVHLLEYAQSMGTV
jgi:hypothetical protein